MSDLDSARLGEAVDLLYEAIAQPELWPSALDALGAAAGGFGAVMLYAPDEKTSGWYNCSPQFTTCLREFFDGGWTSNARTERGLPLTRAGHKIITETLLFKPGELDREPIQTEFFDKYGMRSFIGFEFVPQKILASIERGRREAADWEIAALLRIVPHLDRIGALALARGNIQAQSAIEAFSLINRPAILLDRSGCALRMNEQAERLYPSAFQMREGVLTPLHRGVVAAFRALIDIATASAKPHDLPAPGPLAIPRATGRPLVVRAAPIVGRGRDLFRLGRAILTLVDPDRNPDVGQDALRGIFGLTDTEARVARRLAQGLSLDEISNAHLVTKDTVRTHLREIFAKTQTRRQGELAALLNRIG
jgi:DNA-binding CsgD family transcriptional regulator